MKKEKYIYFTYMGSDKIRISSMSLSDSKDKEIFFNWLNKELNEIEKQHPGESFSILDCKII